MNSKEEVINRIVEIIKRDRAKITNLGDSLLVQQGKQNIRIQLNNFNKTSQQNTFK